MASASIRIDFWDVGQGDCSVITLPTGELIILDPGPSSSPLVPWIIEHPELNIHSIILTHNDADHVGCLTQFLEATLGRVSTLYFLREPQRNYQRIREIFSYAFKLERAKKLEVCNLELPGRDEPRIVWSDSTHENNLRAVFPSFVELQTAGSVNKASAILELVHQGKPVVIWPGDNTIQRVAEKATGSPHLLFGPHHGAPQDVKAASFSLNLQKINPSQVFVSVGTQNKDTHPSKKYLSGLLAFNVSFCCSELTRQCDREGFRIRRPILNSASRLGLRLNGTGRPCRGCMRLTIVNGRILTDGLQDDHLRRVEEHVRNPMCKLNKVTPAA